MVSCGRGGQLTGGVLVALFGTTQRRHERHRADQTNSFRLDRKDVVHGERYAAVAPVSWKVSKMWQVQYIKRHWMSAAQDDTAQGS
jgi:hypothetical protein